MPEGLLMIFCAEIQVSNVLENISSPLDFVSRIFSCSCRT